MAALATAPQFDELKTEHERVGFGVAQHKKNSFLLLLLCAYIENILFSSRLVRLCRCVYFFNWQQRKTSLCSAFFLFSAICCAVGYSQTTKLQVVEKSIPTHVSIKSESDFLACIVTRVSRLVLLINNLLRIVGANTLKAPQMFTIAIQSI